jgi:hypothetical protein
MWAKPRANRNEKDNDRQQVFSDFRGYFDSPGIQHLRPGADHRY